MIPLVMSVIAKTDTFERNMSKARGHVGQFDRSVKRSSMTMAGLSRSILAVAGVGGGLYMLQRGLRGVINEASRTEEIVAKFNVVFRDQAKEASIWAMAFGDTVGRSTQDIKEWMASLQDTFVPLGIARDEAAELSKSLVKLAVDVASFNNKADADVIRDFTSALVGNHETVRKYGIIISESAIKQEALNQGLNKTYKELTDLEKVQLRYSLIQKGTVDAQGDAIRTSESYANQVKRLKANFAELQVALGEQLLPTLTDVVIKMNEFLQNGEKVANAIGRVSAATKGYMQWYHKYMGPTPGGKILKYLGRPKKGEEFQAGPETMGIMPISEKAELTKRLASLGGVPAPEAIENERAFNEEIIRVQAERVDALKVYNDELKTDISQSSLYIKEKFAETARSIEWAMASAFESMITGGANFRDAMGQFFKDVGNAFARMASDMAARAAMSGIMGIFGGSLFGGGGMIAAGGTAAGGGNPYFLHGGGIAGVHGVKKPVPAWAFIGAPRLHNGLRADEVPAILQKGEQVIPKGGGQPTVQIGTYIERVDATDAASFDAQLYRSKQKIADINLMMTKSNHGQRRFEG